MVLIDQGGHWGNTHWARQWNHESAVELRLGLGWPEFGGWLPDVMVSELIGIWLVLQYVINGMYPRVTTWRHNVCDPHNGATAPCFGRDITCNICSELLPVDSLCIRKRRFTLFQGVYIARSIHYICIIARCYVYKYMLLIMINDLLKLFDILNPIIMLDNLF